MCNMEIKKYRLFYLNTSIYFGIIFSIYFFFTLFSFYSFGLAQDINPPQPWPWSLEKPPRPRTREITPPEAAEALSQEERKRILDGILDIRYLERRAAQNARHSREQLLAAEGRRGQYEKLSDDELRRCAKVVTKERQVSSDRRNTGRILNEAIIAAGCPALR